jgi:hypothetical protein
MTLTANFASILRQDGRTGDETNQRISKSVVNSDRQVVSKS